MSTRLLRANSSARDGVSNSSRFSLPSICRTISANSRRLEKRSSTIRTVLRWARANASSDTTPDPGKFLGCALMGSLLRYFQTPKHGKSKNDAGGAPTCQWHHQFGCPGGAALSRRQGGEAFRRCACRARWCGAGPQEKAGCMQRPSFKSLWSGREDSNFRPPAPHAGALPGCATPRPNLELYAFIGGQEVPRSCRISASSLPQVGRVEVVLCAAPPQRSRNWSWPARPPGARWLRTRACAARH